MGSFSNNSNVWQVWADVFTKNQRLVLSGSEKECENFILENDPDQSDVYGSLFMIAPKTGRNSDFTKFEVTK